MISALNPAYTDPAVVPRIIAAYKANDPASVQLQQFLSPETAKELHKLLVKATWKRNCIPDRYCHDVAPLPAAALKLLKDSGVFTLIKAITGVAVTKGTLERFGHRDYTLRNDEEAPPGLVAYLDWTADWEEGWGGETIVADENGELARVGPNANTLVLIDCTTAHPFVRYINHYAGKRALLRVTFR